MIGIGGSSIEAELKAIQPIAHLVQPIQKDEFQNRLNKACELMQEQDVPAVYLHAGTNLYYFTGMKTREYLLTILLVYSRNHQVDATSY